MMASNVRMAKAMEVSRVSVRSRARPIVSRLDHREDDVENEPGDEPRTNGESRWTIYSGTHENGHHRRHE